MTDVRAGTDADTEQVAGLHASEISEGFLSSLGRPFLARLYRRIVRAPQSFLLVADDDGTLVGFIAGTENVRELYRSFVLRDGAIAMLVAFPRVMRSWRRVVETVRYPVATHNGEGAGGPPLPPAELLAMAVAPAARGRGTGRQLVDALTTEFRRRGVGAVRVVVGSDNETAIGLYERGGFTKAASIEVHRGTPSQILTWP